MKAKIEVEVPIEGCRTCKFKTKSGTKTLCVFTGECIDWQESIGERHEKCPMNPTVDKDDRSIDCLGLSVRAYHCLKRSGIDTIGQLRERQLSLPRLRGMGAKTIIEIEDKLNECT